MPPILIPAIADVNTMGVAPLESESVFICSFTSRDGEIFKFAAPFEVMKSGIIQLWFCYSGRAGRGAIHQPLP